MSCYQAYSCSIVWSTNTIVFLTSAFSRPFLAVTVLSAGIPSLWFSLFSFGFYSPLYISLLFDTFPPSTWMFFGTVLRNQFLFWYLKAIENFTFLEEHVNFLTDISLTVFVGVVDICFLCFSSWNLLKAFRSTRVSNVFLFPYGILLHWPSIMTLQYPSLAAPIYLIQET